jgi:hypothetical protein
VKQWHDMSANVLRVPAKESTPVAKGATPKKNPQWTNFERTGGGGDGNPKRQAAKAAQATAANAAPLPRARRGTKLSIEGKQLVLTCKGDDPGLAFNQLGTLVPGPYTLTFRLQSRASGGGTFFWTTEVATSLPNGKRQAFAVTHDGQWHDMTLTISEPKALAAMRLDPCAGEGEVRIESLKLNDAHGTALKSWP